MAGLEVEELRPVAPPFHGVVVGEVLSVEPHPNADRLSVCQVDVGSGRRRCTIVCGAPNVRAGMKAPCALVGAELPPAKDGASEPFQIKVGKLRGVESRGMLCSARELEALRRPRRPARARRRRAGRRRRARAASPRRHDLHAQAHAEPRPLPAASTASRAKSRRSPARRCSAPTFAPVAGRRSDRTLPVTIEAPDLCGRFSGRVVRGVDPKATTPALDGRPPGALRPALGVAAGRHLELRDVRVRPAVAHLRPRQDPRRPRRCAGAGRASRSKLLNGNTVEVDATVGVIADDAGASSRSPASWAATRPRCRTTTRNIYVEAAFWWPEAVAGRSRRFNFSTDAGHRFERGVDPATTVEHIERITRADRRDLRRRRRARPDRRPASSALPRARAGDAARRARRQGDRHAGDAGRVRGGDARASACQFDAAGRASSTVDAAELALRPADRGRPDRGSDPRARLRRAAGRRRRSAPLHGARARARRGAARTRCATRMAALGYQETINFSFVEERWERELAGNADPIRVLNPIAAPLSVMRSSLIGSLVERAALQPRAQGVARARVRDRPGVHARRRRRRRRPLGVAGVRQPMRARRPGLRPGRRRCSGARPSARSTSSTSRATSRRCCAPRRRALRRRRRIRRCIPGRSARDRARRRAHRLHRRAASALAPGLRAARQRRSCSSSTLEALQRRARAGLRAVADASSRRGATSPSWSADERHATTALMDAIDADPAALRASARRCSTSTSRRKPTADIGAGERSLAVRLEIRDDERTLTDERIDARRRRRASQRSAARLGARLREQ